MWLGQNKIVRVYNEGERERMGEINKKGGVSARSSYSN